MYNFDKSRRYDDDVEGPTINLRESIDSKQRAFLHLFKPIHKPDSIIRPMTYHLDTEFTENVISYLDERNHGEHERDIRDRLLSSGNVVPSSQKWFRFGRSQTSEMYRFILVLHNVPSGKRYNTGRNQPRNRAVYSGWCRDEPISPNGRHLNPECELIFTHVSVTDLYSSSSRDGYDTTSSVRVDSDIISNQLASLDSNPTTDRDYYVEHSQVLASMQTKRVDTDYYDDDDFDSIYSTQYNNDVNLISTSKRSYHHPTALNSPRKQYLNLVNGVLGAAKMLRRDKISFMDGDVLMDRSLSTWRDGVDVRDPRRAKDVLQSSLNTRDSNQLFSGPDWTRRTTLGKLVYDYPEIDDNCHVHTCKPLDYDETSEEGSSIMAVASSYIKTAVPSILANYGIGYMSFRYATSDPSRHFIARHEREPIIAVQKVVPSVLEESAHRSEEKAHACIDHIVDTVFYFVEDMVGDIDVRISSNASDDTHVQLQLPEMFEQRVNDEVVYHSRDLGGLNSPLVADGPQLDEYQDLFDSVLGILQEEQSY